MPSAIVGRNPNSLLYNERMESMEKMNALPRRPASLVVAASDGPGG